MDYYLLLICKGDIYCRPGAEDGLWVLFLLPVSVITSMIQNPIILSETYKFVSLCCIGIILASIIIAYKKYKKQRLNVFNYGALLGAVVTTLIIHIFLGKGQSN